MDLPSLRALLTPKGQAALQTASALEPREVDFLSHYQQLSRVIPEELARPALEIAILRREAAAKFPFAERLYLTREALEQASNWQVANYRAGRYTPYKLLADLGCSVGGDTLALAEIAPVVGVDNNPLRLEMARANLDVQNFGERAAFVAADLIKPLPFRFGSDAAIFFDPARRADGRRLRSVRQYQPALEVVNSWLESYPALGVKISPGVQLHELAEYEAEIEFISLEGDLKEAALWFGPLKTASRRATVLPGEYSLVADREDILPISEPLAYLYEPDPAVLRAGLVADLGVRLDAAQLDPDIAYLTAETFQPTPFARTWAVIDWFPFNLKKLRAYLRERGIGQVTVKKRGSPLQPEALIHNLRLKGEKECVVFLTHLSGKPIVVIASPNPIDRHLISS
jgi:SAM-dependent methyltransferase